MQTCLRGFRRHASMPQDRRRRGRVIQNLRRTLTTRKRTILKMHRQQHRHQHRKNPVRSTVGNIRRLRPGWKWVPTKPRAHESFASFQLQPASQMFAHFSAFVSRLAILQRIGRSTSTSFTAAEERSTLGVDNRPRRGVHQSKNGTLKSGKT